MNQVRTLSCTFAAPVIKAALHIAMNKFLLSIFSLVFSLTITAQTPEDFPTIFDKTSSKVILPPAIKMLEESKKLMVQQPEKLKYLNGPGEAQGIAPAFARIKLEPKTVRKAADADYILRISTPGLSYTNSAPVYISENRPATYFAPAAAIKGFIFNIRYVLPVTVELVNKSGTVEKTFQFATDSATMILHANFLLDVSTTEAWKPVKLTAPFPTEQAAMEYFKKNEVAVQKRMEYNSWYYTAEYIKQVLEIAYNNYELPQSSYYSKVFMKKGKSYYSELSDAVEKFYDVVDDLDDSKKGPAMREELKKSMAYFDQQVDSIGKYGPKGQTVVLSNATWCALLNGEREKAANYFTKYYLVENEEYNMFGPFKENYLVYHLHDAMKQSGSTFEPDADISFLTPAKTAPAGIDPALINIARKDGEVEKSNGEMIKGQISIDYVGKNGGIVDLDLGKSATVYFTKNGGETYQFAKVNNTKQIRIGDRVFEPVTRKTSAIMGVLNAAGGDFGNTYFMERLYEKNGYAVYRYWAPGEILLIKQKDDKAVDFGSVITRRKLADKLLESAKGAEEFVKSSNLKNTLEDAKKLVDFMAMAGN